jgi:hypothetical protein
MQRKDSEGGYEGKRVYERGGLSFYGEFYFGGFSWICREGSLSSGVRKD